MSGIQWARVYIYIEGQSVIPVCQIWHAFSQPPLPHSIHTNQVQITEQLLVGQQTTCVMCKVWCLSSLHL